MDFKPYTEVILTPEKGTGIRRGQAPRAEHSRTREVLLKASEPRSSGAAVSEAAPAGTAAVLEEAAAKVSQGAAVAPVPTALPREPRRRAPRKGGSDTGRDFIVSYEGRFIGHYRSTKRVTNRTAFQEIARQLTFAMDGFDVRGLKLYRPVELEVELPESLEDITGGSFEWFQRHERELLDVI